jgi:hypothetical protein
MAKNFKPSIGSGTKNLDFLGLVPGFVTNLLYDVQACPFSYAERICSTFAMIMI